MILSIEEFTTQIDEVETKIMNSFNYNADDFEDDDWRNIFDDDSEKLVSKYFTSEQKEKFYDLLNKYRNYLESLSQFVEDDEY